MFRRVVLTGNILASARSPRRSFSAGSPSSRPRTVPELVLALAILAGWGLIGGWIVLERQLLVYHGRFALASIVTLLTPAAMAAYGLASAEPGISGFVYTGLATSVASLLLAATLNRGHWRTAFAAAAEEQIPRHVTWVPVIVASIPIILASFNAQAMAIIDQTMAAWWQVGGLGLLATALAVGRLPHTVAESLAHSLGYRMMLEAVSACQNRRPDGPSALTAAFKKLALTQAAIILPAVLFIVFFPHEIVALLFQRGTFSPADAAQTSEILRWLPACAVGLMLQSIQVQILVAWGAAATALRTELVLTFLSALSNFAFLPFLGLPGLIASTALSVTLVAFFLFGVLQRVTGVIHWRDLADALLPLAMPLAAALLVTLGLRILLPQGMNRALQVFLPGGLIAAVFYGLLFVRVRAASRSAAPAADAPLHQAA